MHTHLGLAVFLNTERSKLFLFIADSKHMPSLGSSVVGLTHIAHRTHDGPWSVLNCDLMSGLVGSNLFVGN